LFALIAAASIGCGDNGGPPLDNGENNDDPVPLSSCEKFADPAGVMDRYPAVYDGTLDLASAAIDVGEGSCATEEAPFGVAAPGPESVIALTELNPGQEYRIRLYSQSDLALYVATDCDEALRGPAAGSCLLFTDDTVQPPESGTFIAPSTGEATLIVDYFLNASPVAGAFSLDVYEVECNEDAECGGSFCVDQRCVECATSFGCDSAATPICDARTNECVAGDDLCDGDDESEGFNDGPAGATDVTPDGSPAVADGAICNNPQSEQDFFKFTVSSAGASYTVDVDWDDSEDDLDVAVFDADGNQLGASLWKRPESLELTYLPVGTYYMTVNLFGGNNTFGQPYTVTVTETSTEGCTAVSDCAASYDTQLFRGVCDVDGACYDIEYETAAAGGEICDSSSDCDSGLCSAFSFSADADTRAVCSSTCASDDECSGFGDFVCTDYLLSNMCVPKCENDLQCAVLIGTRPTCEETDTACLLNPPIWEHLSCDTETGRCAF